MPKSSFRQAVRAAVRGLWAGHFDVDQFLDEMIRAIRYGFEMAWREGAAECGVFPADYSPEEKMALETAIIEQYNHVWGVTQAIEKGSKGSGGKLAPLMRRADMWINRYDEVRSHARTMACRDLKLVWVFGDTVHCKSCAALNGKVKRGSYWEKVRALGVYPQSPALECKGFRCQCKLLWTDEPVSRGPLPRI